MPAKQTQRQSHRPRFNAPILRKGGRHRASPKAARQGANTSIAQEAKNYMDDRRAQEHSS